MQYTVIVAFKYYNDAKLELPLTDSINLAPFENALGVVKVNSKQILSSHD